MRPSSSGRRSELKVVCPVDCGNAKRKEILRDWNIAWARGEAAAADLLGPTTWCTSRWVRPQWKERRPSWRPSPAGSAAMRQGPEELHIHNIITHGNTAALNASLLMPGGPVEYCHVYLFNGFAKSAKLKRITEYRIETGAN